MSLVELQELLTSLEQATLDAFLPKKNEVIAQLHAEEIQGPAPAPEYGTVLDFGA